MTQSKQVLREEIDELRRQNTMLLDIMTAGDIVMERLREEIYSLKGMLKAA